jgi:hypothetical protein
MITIVVATDKQVEVLDERKEYYTEQGVGCIGKLDRQQFESDCIPNQIMRKCWMVTYVYIR